MAAAYASQPQSRMDTLRAIQSWVKENPNRKRSVLPIEIRILSDTQEGEEAPATLPGGWVPTPLEPPGPVSLWLWKTNPEYRAAGAPVRRTILRDSLLTLGTRVDAELRGAKWSRKKVQEQLAAQQTAAVSPPMDTPELDRGLAALIGVQIVQVDEANKKVRFVPPDLRTWSAEFPVWGSTTGARAVLHRQGEESVGTDLALWLGQRESEGWRVAWPEADGTLEELKGKLTQRGIGVGGTARLEKPKKADYAAAVGRAEAISHLSSVFGARSR
jgi:hypothetical protein